MRALFIIEQGTESTEFFVPINILQRAGIETKVFSDYSGINFGNYLGHLEDLFSDEFRSWCSGWRDFNNDMLNYFDIVIIPGGEACVKSILGYINSPYVVPSERGPNSSVGKAIIGFINEGKLIAAIGEAPSILGELGILKGKKYTCYPGFDNQSFGGTYTKKEVEIDGNIITARSMFYSIDFGLAIVEKLLGKKKRKEVENEIKGAL